MNFKHLLIEAEKEDAKKAGKPVKPKNIKGGTDQKKYLTAAMKWLSDRFGDSFRFVHKEDLRDIDKTYNCEQDGQHFSISGRRYDSNGDGKVDTVLFRIDDNSENKEEDGF